MSHASRHAASGTHCSRLVVRRLPDTERIAIIWMITERFSRSHPRQAAESQCTSRYRHGMRRRCACRRSDRAISFKRRRPSTSNPAVDVAVRQPGEPAHAVSDASSSQPVPACLVTWFMTGALRTAFSPCHTLNATCECLCGPFSSWRLVALAASTFSGARRLRCALWTARCWQGRARIPCGRRAPRAAFAAVWIPFCCLFQFGQRDSFFAL